MLERGRDIVVTLNQPIIHLGAHMDTITGKHVALCIVNMHAFSGIPQ